MTGIIDVGWVTVIRIFFFKILVSGLYTLLGAFDIKDRVVPKNIILHINYGLSGHALVAKWWFLSDRKVRGLSCGSNNIFVKKKKR